MLAGEQKESSFVFDLSVPCVLPSTLYTHVMWVNILVSLSQIINQKNKYAFCCVYYTVLYDELPDKLPCKFNKLRECCWALICKWWCCCCFVSFIISRLVHLSTFKTIFYRYCCGFCFKAKWAFTRTDCTYLSYTFGTNLIGCWLCWSI